MTALLHADLTESYAGTRPVGPARGDLRSKKQSVCKVVDCPHTKTGSVGRTGSTTRRFNRPIIRRSEFDR